MLTTIIVCFWLGFDLRGSVEASPSEATGLLEKLGIHSIGKLYSSHSKTRGILNQNTALCTHCGACMDVCPKGVFDFVKTEKRVVMARPEVCFTCGACVFQCPEGALKLS
jgi:NAD-dependent dihydropyrimidine dehydrogenase PreA subunit